MAKAITKYEAENGKQFDTEIEARIEDAESKLRKFVEDCGSYHMENEHVSNMIIDNVDSFYRLLSEIKGLKNLKIGVAPPEQEEDPTGTWNLVIDHIIQ